MGQMMCGMWVENLARALGERLGVPYRTERKPDGSVLGYALVTDSLRPKYKGFNADHWDPDRWEDRKEPLVIIDECEHVPMGQLGKEIY